MTSNMTKFQIATKPGHRAQEHLFVFKSVIALHILLGLATILSMWDLSKFFDRESLLDFMNELYKIGITGKLYRLLYTMNKNTKISVQKPRVLTDTINFKVYYMMLFDILNLLKLRKYTIEYKNWANTI